jgi:hypothetical protein
MKAWIFRRKLEVRTFSYSCVLIPTKRSNLDLQHMKINVSNQAF